MEPQTSSGCPRSRRAGDSARRHASDYPPTAHLEVESFVSARAAQFPRLASPAGTWKMAARPSAYQPREETPMYQQPNAPQSIGGVLDSGFKLYRESLSQAYLLAVVAALVTAPANLMQPYFVRNGVSGLIGAPGLLIIAIALAAAVVYGALIARIDAVARGAPLSLGAALSVGLQRLAAMILSGFVVIIVVVIGLCLLIIPGLILMIWLVFAPFAVVILRRGPIQSLSYSYAIVRGHWWRTAALLTIIGIVLMVVYLLFGVGVSIALISDPVAAAAGQVPWYVSLIVGPALAALIGPLTYALMLAIFYDLRLRHEGGDLAARIAATA
jgi:hypothetical protein